MIKYNLLLALRSLIKQRKYAFINIFGLALGLACFILITVWVKDELSYDRFHEDAENIHIVFRKHKDKRAAVSSKLLAPAIKNEVPEIAEATCFMQLPEAFKSTFEYKEKSFTELFALADLEFFKVFSFPLIRGEPDQIFKTPSYILISERASMKYFGTMDALDKNIFITVLGEKKLLTVKGIMKNIPHNSHIQTDIILPLEFMNQFGINWDVWYNQSPTTYIRTESNISIAQLEEKILACKQGHFLEEDLSYEVMPITKVHLNSSGVEYFTTTGDIKYIYIFSAIAAIILLIACMNYMNLSNALSLKRSREIGIRKAQGSRRIQIIQQFLGETFILVFIALALALVLVQLGLPLLNFIAGKSLTIEYTSFQFISIILLVAVLTSIVSGIYPALFASDFQPIQVLKGKFISSPQSAKVRQGLVVFQFVLSIVIIIVTITISNQLHFIQNIDLGYDKEHVVCVALRGDVSNDLEAFKNEILASGHVSKISRSGRIGVNTLSRTEGVNWPGKQDDFQTWVLHVDENYAETYGLEMAEGRFYSRDYSTDLSNGFVINQKAAMEMGFENPIGQQINVWGRQGTIIGITKDFHFSSLYNKIEPLLFRIPDPDQVNSRCSSLSMRIKPNSMPQSLNYIEEAWKSYFPAQSFDYYFMTDRLKVNYLSEARMGTLFKYSSIFVVLIACLGLYGLTAFNVEQKQKEIGVYKVMGAKASDVILLFLKGYFVRIILAALIAVPIAWYAMSQWLSNFAYRTELSWWIFVLAGLIALGIAMLTVSWQSWRAAMRNPVESLRYE